MAMRRILVELLSLVRVTFLRCDVGWDKKKLVDFLFKTMLLAIDDLF